VDWCPSALRERGLAAHDDSAFHHYSAGPCAGAALLDGYCSPCFAVAARPIGSPTCATMISGWWFIAQFAGFERAGMNNDSR
jgi:hypothetical protein